MTTDLIEIFKRIKSMMKTYEGELTAKIDLDSRYDLWSVKDLIIAGRKRKEVSFASIIIQSGYVGFYYMPVYTDEELKEIMSPDLLKLRKGKACFHIKKLDEALEKDIKEALALGYDLYRELGWIMSKPPDAR